MLTLVGRAADALALGDAELDGLRGDAHADLCLQLARTAITAGAWADAEAYVARAGRPGDPRSLVLRADAAFGAGRAVDAGRFAAAAIARAEQVLDEQQRPRSQNAPRTARNQQYGSDADRSPTPYASRPPPRSAKRSGWRAGWPGAPISTSPRLSPDGPRRSPASTAWCPGASRRCSSSG